MRQSLLLTLTILCSVTSACAQAKAKINNTPDAGSIASAQTTINPTEAKSGAAKARINPTAKSTINDSAKTSDDSVKPSNGSKTTINNPAIDMKGYLAVANEAARYRESHRLTEDEFIGMGREPGTIILD